MAKRMSDSEYEAELKGGLSRRDFIKGAAAGAAGIAAMGLLGACGEAGEPAPVSEPEASSSESETAAESESSTAGTEAATTEPATQPANSGSDSWLGNEPDISNSDITETLETQVLVVGSGLGGLFAACSAAEEGAEVLVINKLSASTGCRDDLGSINSRIQQQEGMEIDVHDAVREMVKYSAGRCDTRLLYLWARESGQTVDWYDERLQEVGVKLWNEAGHGNPQGKYPHYPTGHSPEWPEDNSLNGGKVLTDYAESKGVQFRNSCPMVKLVKEGGRVTGVIAQDTTDDHYIKITATKGVIVATGGYSTNPEMLHALSPETMSLTGKHNGSVPGTTGDGIKACLWAGAAQDDVHTLMIFDRACMKPGDTAGPDTESKFFWLGSQPLLKVDATGNRFCNESCTYDFLPHAASMLPGNSHFTIWDANLEEHIHQLETQGCSRMFDHENGAPPDIPFVAVQGMLEGLVEDGFVIKADTVEELAQGLGLPVDAFAATVERYNELNRNGEDVDFGKEPFRLTPLDTAPYYGARNCAYILCSLDGIRINTEMQALDSDKQPIEGLYVVGNDSGGFFAHSYPNLLTGVAAGRTITFGRRAGRIVAAL